jgi:hypothetical protein
LDETFLVLAPIRTIRTEPYIPDQPPADRLRQRDRTP